MQNNTGIAERIIDRARNLLDGSGVSWMPVEREEHLLRYIEDVYAWSGKLNLVGRADLAENISNLIIDSMIMLDYAVRSGVCGEPKDGGGVSSGTGFKGRDDRGWFDRNTPRGTFEGEGRVELKSEDTQGRKERPLTGDDNADESVGADGVGVVRVADIGSGAGFPGLVWKIAFPGFLVTLFERRRRAAYYLLRVVRILGLKGVDVRDEDAEVYIRTRRKGGIGRGEGESGEGNGTEGFSKAGVGMSAAGVEYNGRGPGFDIMLAKAAGRLPEMLPIAEKILRTGGLFISIKGTGWKGELKTFHGEGMCLTAAEEAPLDRGELVVFTKTG